MWLAVLCNWIWRARCTCFRIFCLTSSLGSTTGFSAEGSCPDSSRSERASSKSLVLELLWPSSFTSSTWTTAQFTISFHVKTIHRRYALNVLHVHQFWMEAKPWLSNRNAHFLCFKNRFKLHVHKAEHNTIFNLKINNFEKKKTFYSDDMFIEIEHRLKWG